MRRVRRLPLRLAAASALLVIAAASMAIDLDPLWNFSDPAESERRMRAALETAAGDDALILQTQIARSYGLRKQFDRARELLESMAVWNDARTEALESCVSSCGGCVADAYVRPSSSANRTRASGPAAAMRGRIEPGPNTTRRSRLRRRDSCVVYRAAAQAPGCACKVGAAVSVAALSLRGESCRNPSPAPARRMVSGGAARESSPIQARQQARARHGSRQAQR